MTRLRTAVFNDSPTARALLRAVLERTEQFEIVAEADDGIDAARICETARPDLVLMDVVMPGCNGFEATKAIMAAHPVPIVIVSAVVDVRDADVLFEAMRIGALFVVGLPPGGGTTRDEIKQNAFAQTLLNVIAGVRADRRVPSATTGRHVRAPVTAADVDVIGLCASAGGPAAITRVLARLDPTRMPPILLVQHIAAGFVETFARWLDGQTRLTVRLADADAIAESGHVYLAPADRHVGWASRRGRVVVSDAPPVGQFRPSASFLLESLASAGPRAIGIVLSGMGDDGAAGAVQLRAKGGCLVVQSREGCAVYGMPLAARKAAGADEELTPDEIGEWLVRRCGGAS
jgi:two-component system chemotaxis response regulator CheB